MENTHYETDNTQESVEQEINAASETEASSQHRSSIGGKNQNQKVPTLQMDKIFQNRLTMSPIISGLGTSPSHKKKTQAKFESFDTEGSNVFGLQKITEFDANFAKVNMELLPELFPLDKSSVEEKEFKFKELLKKLNDNEDKLENYDMMMDENKELENHVEKLMTEVEQLQNTLRDRNQTIDKLDDQLQGHEVFQDYKELSDSHEALQSKMEKETRQFAESLNLYQLQKNTIQYHLDEATEENTALKTQIQEKDSTLDSKNYLILELEGTINQLTQQIELQGNEVDELVVEKENLINEKNQEFESKVQDLENQINNLNQIQTQHNQRSSRIHMENQELKLSNLISARSHMGMSDDSNKVPRLKFGMISSETLEQEMLKPCNNNSKSGSRFEQNSPFDSTSRSYGSEYEEDKSQDDEVKFAHLSEVEEEKTGAQVPSKSRSSEEEENVDPNIFDTSFQPENLQTSILHDKYMEKLQNTNNSLSSRLQDVGKRSGDTVRVYSSIEFRNSSGRFGDGDLDDFKSFGSASKKSEQIGDSLQPPFKSPKSNNIIIPKLVFLQICTLNLNLDIEPLILQKADVSTQSKVEITDVSTQIECLTNEIGILCKIKEKTSSASTMTQIETRNSHCQSVNVVLKEKGQQCKKSKTKDQSTEINSKQNDKVIKVPQQLMLNKETSYEIFTKDQETSYDINTQDQSTMCGGPPRQSKGTSSQTITSKNMGIMTENHDIHNICTMTDEQQVQDFDIQHNISAHNMSGFNLSYYTSDITEQSEAEILYVIETEKVQKLIKVFHIEEEYTPVNKRLENVSYKNNFDNIEKIKKTILKDVGVMCQANTAEVAISACTQETCEASSNTMKLSMIDNCSNTMEKELKNQSTQREISQTDTGTNSTMVESLEQSTQMELLNHTSQSTQMTVNLINQTTNTFLFTSSDAETQLNVNSQDQSTTQDSSIAKNYRSDASTTCDITIKQQQRNVGIQCRMKEDSPKTSTLLKKENDALQSRLAEKSMSLNESYKHIKNLQNINESFNLSSARSMDQDHELIALIKKLKDKNDDNTKLNDELKKLQVLHKTSQGQQKVNESKMNSGDEKEMKNKIKDLSRQISQIEEQHKEEVKKQIDQIEEQHQEEIKTMHESRQEILANLLKEMQKTQQFEVDKQKLEEEKMQTEKIINDNSKQTQELINNTLKMKKQSQIMERKQQQLMDKNKQANQDTRLMVEIKVQEKLINNSVEKQKLSHNQNVPLQTILEEEIQSQLYSSSSLDDHIPVEEFDKIMCSLKEQHDHLVEKFKIEVETSKTNAVYFLDENKKQEQNYNTLLEQYDSIREEKLNLEKDYIQKDNDRAQQIRETQSQMEMGDQEDMVEFGESDSDEDYPDQFGRSNIFEAMGSKTHDWLTKNRKCLRKVKPFEQIIKDVEFERSRSNLQMSSSSEDGDEADKSMVSIKSNQLNTRIKSQKRESLQYKSVKTERGERGRSMPRLCAPNKLDFQYNVLNFQQVTKHMHTRKLVQKRPTMEQMKKPLDRMRAVREDLEVIVRRELNNTTIMSTNVPYQNYSFGF